MNNAHLLQFLPFSRKPLAKGLAAIFNCVIWGHTHPGSKLPWPRGQGPPPPPSGVTYPRVLVGCHGDECGLREAEGGDAAPVLAAELGCPHQVYAGLVLVHGVQDQLGEKDGADSLPGAPPPPLSLSSLPAGASHGRGGPGCCW